MAEAGLGTFIKEAGIPIVTGLLGGLFNRGNDKASKQATKAQLELSKQLLDIFKQQAAIDLPFKRDVTSALRDRIGRNIPRFTPSRGAAVNPLARRTRATSIPQTQSLPVGPSRTFAPPPGQGSNEGRLGRALMGAFNQPRQQGGFGGNLQQFFEFADQAGADPLGALASRQAGQAPQQPQFDPSQLQQLAALLQRGR